MLDASDQLQSNAPADNSARAEKLVPLRLATAGLDVAYLDVALPRLIAEIKRVCATCNDSDRCRHDFELSDANERIALYCPNTPTVDALQIERTIGKTF